MQNVSRRSLLGTVGAAATTAALGTGTARAQSAAPEARPARPRPVAPVNQEVAAAHSIDYQALPQQVVGVDVEQLMTVHTEADVERLRAQLVAEVWKSADGQAARHAARGRTGRRHTRTARLHRAPARRPAHRHPAVRPEIRRLPAAAAPPRRPRALRHLPQRTRRDARDHAAHRTSPGGRRIRRTAVCHAALPLEPQATAQPHGPGHLRDPGEPQRLRHVGDRGVLHPPVLPGTPHRRRQPRHPHLPAPLPPDDRPVRRRLDHHGLPGARPAHHPQLPDGRVPAVLPALRTAQAEPDHGRLGAAARPAPGLLRDQRLPRHLRAGVRRAAPLGRRRSSTGSTPAASTASATAATNRWCGNGSR